MLSKGRTSRMPSFRPSSPSKRRRTGGATRVPASISSEGELKRVPSSVSENVLQFNVANGKTEESLMTTGNKAGRSSFSSPSAFRAPSAPESTTTDIGGEGGAENADERERAQREVRFIDSFDIVAKLMWNRRGMILCSTLKGICLSSPTKSFVTNVQRQLAHPVPAAISDCVRLYVKIAPSQMLLVRNVLFSSIAPIRFTGLTYGKMARNLVGGWIFRN